MQVVNSTLRDKNYFNIGDFFKIFKLAEKILVGIP